MFPNKAAAARYWAAHPNSPLNPNRSPGSGGAWGPDGKVISPSKAPKKPGKNKTTKPGRANINAFLASIRSQDPTSTGIPFNPLAGMPGQETLDPFPFMEGSLPDGSDIKNVNSPAAKYGKASLLDPVKFADLMGRKSYQPVIDSLSQERAGLEGGVGQANSMIDSSYGDAAKGAAAGGASILAATAQGKQSLTDLAARMAAVAGGDPTAAAALGASSAQAQTEMQGFGNIAAEGQNDMAAAATRDAALAKLGYRSSVDSKLGDITERIGQAKTAGTQAEGKAQMDALGFNSDQMTSQLGRDAAKQDLWLAAAQAGRQLTAADLANAGTRQTLKLNSHNAKVNDWSTLTSAKQSQYNTNMTRWGNANLAKQLKAELEKGNKPPVLLALADPDARAAIGKDVIGPVMRNGSPTLDPAKMNKYIRQTLRQTYGGSSPAARESLAKLFMSQIVPQWEADHPNATNKWVNTKGDWHLVKR
jgi:hypothetical protein